MAKDDKDTAQPIDTAKIKTAPNNAVTNSEVTFPLAFQIHQLDLKLAAQARTLIAGHGDLTLPQWRIIRIIGMGAADGSTSIRKTLDFDKSQFSKTVSQLQANGLVEQSKHPSDGRQFCLILTKAGQAALDSLSPVLGARNEALMQSLNEEEQAVIHTALSKLSLAAQVTDIDPTKPTK